MNAVSIRGDWVGRTIDRRFPLIAWLGGSGTSGIFLTEIDGTSKTQATTDGSPSGSGPLKAAIKLMPASAQAEDRFAIWTAAASLSHPHLVRILRSGRAEIDGGGVVYVVTELAEEVLAQILPERPLTPEETREMLGPVLDALTYLHSKGYVHGHLKPSNILVVEDEVKLSSDGLILAGSTSHEALSNDLHNAPETASRPVTPAADTWSLGVTLVETLTQDLPIWDAATDTEAVLPTSLPTPFAEIVRECLHANPARRCTLNDIRAMLEGKPRPTAAPPAVHVRHPPHRLVEKAVPAKIPLVPLIIGFILLVAIIIALALRSHKTHAAPLQTENTIQAPTAVPGPMTGPKTVPEPSTGGSENGAALNRAVPDVPRVASNTIQGRIGVTVRLTVDPTGAISNAEFASRGSSAYFARLALESARKWTFKPPIQKGRPVASTWLLHYEFRRDGTDVTPEQTAP